jgi:hypothetical protein
LDEKFIIMDRIIRRTLTEKGFDPDEAIEKNKAKYNEEEAAIEALRASKA